MKLKETEIVSFSEERNINLVKVMARNVKFSERRSFKLK